MNNITLPELMPAKEHSKQENVCVQIRKRKLKLTRKICAVVLLCVGALALCAVGIDKLSSGAAADALKNKLSGLFGSESSFGSISSALTPQQSTSPTDTSMPEDTLPVILPIESEEEYSTATPETDRSETVSPEPEETKKEPQNDSVKPQTPIPENAVRIVSGILPQSRPTLLNHSARHFDTDFLETMSSAIIPATGSGPIVLVIHTHTSEGYLPEGTEYYLPEGGELARNTNEEENIVAVGKAFCEALEAAGISAIHVTEQNDSEGSSKAYINSRNRIAEVLAIYPSIKYVIDLHRDVVTDSNGNLVRTAASLNGKNYAPITLTVSGGANLSGASVNANLSLALQLNDLLSDHCRELSNPVLIADAVYTDGHSPRSLKIDIGSCASTLEEAKESASLLGELFSLLIKS